MSLDPTLKDLLRTVEPVEDHPYLNGEQLTAEAYEETDEPLKSLIPHWLVDVLTTYAVATMIIRFVDESGAERAFQFASFDDMWDHFFSVLPSKTVCYLGYIVIAVDPARQDTPYFVSAAGDCNSPIYQLTDTADADLSVGGHSFVQVAANLQQVLERQLR